MVEKMKQLMSLTSDVITKMNTKTSPGNSPERSPIVLSPREMSPGLEIDV